MYLYNDIFPKIKKYEQIERKENVLKRLTNNYYTVEDMKAIEENIFSKEIESQFSKIDDDFNKIIFNNTKNKTSSSKNQILKLGEFISLNLSFGNFIENKCLLEENLYQMKIKKLLNVLEQKEIISKLNDTSKVSIILDKENKETIVNLYNKSKEYDAVMNF